MARRPLKHEAAAGDRVREGVNARLERAMEASRNRGNPARAVYGPSGPKGSPQQRAKKRAEGGDVRPDPYREPTGAGAYMVGEKGPEMFVPDRSGTIIPNHELQKLARKYGGRVGSYKRAEGGRVIAGARSTDRGAMSPLGGGAVWTPRPQR
jgi:hypothetical protein